MPQGTGAAGHGHSIAGWPEEALHFHIALKELFALVMACATWGHEWCGSQVKCWCDNEAAVWAIERWSCRDPALMHLLRCLFFLEAHYQFELVAVHISGVSNDLADDLSCNCLPSKALHMGPTAGPHTAPPCLFSFSSRQPRGPLQPGRCGSRLLSLVARKVHTPYVPVSPETIHRLLFDAWCCQSFPCTRGPTVLFCGFPGQTRGGP